MAAIGAAILRAAQSVFGAAQRAVQAVVPSVTPTPAPVPQPAPATPVAQPAATPVKPDNFPACLTVILASEGGFVIDQGGPTNLGVTIPALSAFMRKPCDTFDIRALTPASVAPLYRSDFYNVAHCNELPAGLDLMAFDEAVNEGPGRAIRHLQEALGLTVDGMFGPGTRAAVQACDVAATIGKLHDTNATYYQSLDAQFPQDEGGWQSRNDRTAKIALTMVGR